MLRPAVIRRWFAVQAWMTNFSQVPWIVDDNSAKTATERHSLVNGFAPSPERYFCVVTGCCSKVCWMKALMATHFSWVWFCTSATLFCSAERSFSPWKCVICAIFLLNLSVSRLIKASFFFIAPGLHFKLLCFVFVSPAAVPSTESGTSGKALARDSRSVTNFLDGRLRFLGMALDFSTREIKFECLMARLSLFVTANALSGFRFDIFEEGTWGLGFEVRERVEDRLPIEEAWLP